MSDCRLRIALCIVTAGLALASSSWAQFRGYYPAGGSPPTNGRLELSYLRATEAIDAEQWDRAIDELQDIIDGADDAFPLDVGEQLPGTPRLTAEERGRSWKSLAAEALDNLPGEGQKAYETRYEAITRANLAAKENDALARLRLAMQRRWTTAGRDELLRQASLAIDAGYGIRASQIMGRVPPISNTADDVADESIGRMVELSDRIFRSQAEPVTTTWHRSGGSPRGTAAVGSAPVSSDGVWKVPLVEDYDAGEAVESFEQALSEALKNVSDSGRSTIPFRPAIEPIVVGRHAILAGLGRVRAYDIESGELAWRSALADKTFQYLTRRVLGRPEITAAKRQLWMLEKAASDRNQGTLSSNGELVFAVVDSGSEIWDDIDSPETGKHPLARSLHNRLIAFDAASGLIKWWSGGPSVGALPAPMAGVYFLGPPALVGDRAFVVGEEGRQIRLYEIDLESGEPVSSQDLWNGSDDNTYLRISEPTTGVTPLVVGSIAITVLKDVLVAVDTLDGNLLWVARRDARTNNRFALSMMLRESANDNLPSNVLMRSARENYPRTVATFSTVFDLGKLELAALDVATGESRWSVPRLGIVWLECVTNDALVAVTTSGLTAYAVEDGSTLWTQQLPPASGAGLWQDGLLSVPLQTGEIATIDISTGDLIARTPTRSGTPMGTLVGVNGRTVSFNGRELVGFEEVPGAASGTDIDFAALTDDERESWRERAAERLHHGQGVESLKILESLNTVEPGDRSVETLLAAALIVSAKTDPERAFAIARRLELDRLPKSTSRAIRQFLIERFAGAGDALGEARQHIGLIALGTTQETVDFGDGRTLSLRQTSIARLARLVDEMSVNGLDTLRTEFADRLANANRFAILNLSGAVPNQLVDGTSAVRLAAAAVPFAKAENLLWKTLDERDDLSKDDIATAATSLGAIYARAGRAFDLASVRERFGDVESAAWTSLFEKSSVERLLRITREWSAGPIEVRSREVLTSGQGLTRLPILHGRPSTKSFGQWLTGPQHRSFELVDPRGQTAETFDMYTRVPYSDRVVYVETLGHLAVVARFARFEIVDVLQHPPQTLSSFNLSVDGEQIVYTARGSRNSLKTITGSDRQRRPIGTVGPLTSTQVTYLQGDRLTAIDPYAPNEMPQWTRTGVPAGSELFGDDDVILARPPGSNDLLGFHRLDGSDVSVEPFPDDVWPFTDAEAIWQSGQSLVGSSVLRHQRSDTAQTLSLFDLVTGKTSWTMTLPVDAEIQRHAAILLVASPSTGLIQLVSVDSGKVLGSDDVRELSEPVYSFHRDETRAFVFCGTAPTENIPEVGPAERHARPISSEMTLVNGPVIAFDLESGETLWKREVKDQRLPQDQARGWPFLLFASNYVFPQEEGSSKIASHLRMELLDKATGETLWQDEELPYSRVLRWQPRRAGLPGTSIRLSSVTLDVRPQEPEKDAEPPTGNTEPKSPAADGDDAAGDKETNPEKTSDKETGPKQTGPEK